MLDSSNHPPQATAADVLVVDDEPMVRDFISRVLTRNGFACRTASDAGEAMASATDRAPMVVVSDIRMPGKDGTWLLAELKKRWPEMPVLMLSAISEAKHAVACLKAGAQDYLVKPIDVDELLISVRRAIERLHLVEAARRQREELEKNVLSRTALLQGALSTIEAAYQDTLGALVQAPPHLRLPPGSLGAELQGAERAAPTDRLGALGADEAIELASLRIAGKLIAEGGTHLEVAEAMAKELVGRNTAVSARLWTRRANELGLEAVIQIGGGAEPEPSLARRALASGRTQWQEEAHVTSVASPVVVRGIPECALELGWRGPRREDMGSLTERLALILAASLSRENDARKRLRTTEELELFQKLAGASRYSLDLQHVAVFLLKSLHRIVDYDAAALLLLEDEPSLCIQARCRMDEEFSERVRSHIGNTLKLTCGLEPPAGLELRMLESDQDKCQRDAPPKLRSFVNVPLSVGGSVVGLIHVSSGKDHAFGEEEVAFVHRAADFLASSVQGVRELLATVKGRIEQMVDHMTDGVLMLDGRGRVVAMNGAARQVLGCEAEGVPPDAEGLARLLEWNPISVMRDERRSLRKLVCLRGVPYQTQLSPVLDGNGQVAGTVLAFRDFEQEKKADDLKTEVVSVVSHELRTPVTAIRNALSLLSGPRLGGLSAGQTRFVDLARRNVEQLIGIIDDLLDLSKIEAGKMHFDLEPISMAEPVGDVLAAMEPQAEEKGVRLEASMPEGLPRVRGHRASLQRVLVNLVGNALKFTDAGGRISVEVASADGSELGAPAGAVRVTVSDSGLGIPAEQLERIFEKFQQVEAQEHRKVPGTGLGLSISRELVKAHHGRIWAESEAGRGSRFSFLIPVLSEEELLMRSVAAEMDRARERDGSFLLVIARIQETGEEALDDLLAVARAVVRRSSDHVVCRRDSGEIAILLPRTPRDGAEAFEKRLQEAFARSSAGRKLALSLSSVHFPEDAGSAEELYRLAAEKIDDTVAA